MTEYRRPDISAVILTHNKKEYLETCLRSVLAQDWPDLEVIVVDNASGDGTADMVAQRFGPRVKLLRRTENAPLEARNEGYASAGGAYILSLDDDIVLPDPSVISKMVARLDACPEAAAVAFLVGPAGEPATVLSEHWWHPVAPESVRGRPFLTSYFPEGAVGLRREDLRESGGYDEALFWDMESVDLVLRWHKRGRAVICDPGLIAGELRVRGSLHTQRSRRNYLHLRNRIWLAWKHYPAVYAVWYVLGRIAVAGYRAARAGWLDHFIDGVRDGMRPPSAIRSGREPLTYRQLAGLMALRRGHFLDG